MRFGFRHCDPRFGFLWLSAGQLPGRWHGAGEGPANYFADTPSAAWAEFLRHEGIVEAEDLAGVRRSLWAVELPRVELALPVLPEAILYGDESSYPACQAEARRLRAAGATGLRAPSAAIVPGLDCGWTGQSPPQPVPGERVATVTVLFGAAVLRGWEAVAAGQPPERVLPLVRPLF